MEQIVNLEEAPDDPSGRDRPAVAGLVITADSLPLWRRLGPLAWMTLQYLALNSHRSKQGWAAPVGVRDIAAGIGVTKDTAAGAVSRAMRAGLVTRETVTIPGSCRRSGYVLHLPDTMWLGDRPDGVTRADAEHRQCPKGEYSRRTTNPPGRLIHPDTRRNGSRPRTGNGPDAPEKASPGRSCDQPALFGAGAAGRVPCASYRQQR